ncbi:MAG: hypothetical protein AVDCRST_MAG27-2059 [uncultured Craurococcus sp.]|uniref:Uncharacterized protein n=1 Tax=uncultured Craurococcus sp. TaxID=1135998 RepID=A0A6J4IJF4_9PROT|nr:MAG: hypothetical protein AVDCRST_MAG27-2059 [uncultured Craurococcus sp.]
MFGARDGPERERRIHPAIAPASRLTDRERATRNGPFRVLPGERSRLAGLG